MAKKVPRRVSTLRGFLDWAEQFNDGQYLFRGVRKKSYKIEAGACRRLPKSDRYNPAKLLKINQELIDKARLLGHDQLDGERLSDLPLLAELQHFRAATCLIDFTRNALIALWFACEQISTKESENKVEETDGKVYAVRIDDPSRFKTITSELLGKRLIIFLKRMKMVGIRCINGSPNFRTTALSLSNPFSYSAVRKLKQRTNVLLTEVVKKTF